MKVLIMTWACDLEDVSEPGVSAKWVSEISKDHEVTVFAVSRPDRYGCVKQQFPELNVIEWKDIRVPKKLERFRAIVKPGYFSYYIKARFFLKKFLKENDLDLIHHLTPFSWRYPSPAVGLGLPLIRGPIAGGLKTPVGLSNSDINYSGGFFSFLRGTDDFRKQYDPLLRSSFANSDHVLMAVPYVEETLTAMGSNSLSIEIELGLNELPPLSNKPVDNIVKTTNLLFVGRVIVTKGLFYAIKAFSESNSLESSHFNIVGDGNDIRRCKEEVNRLGLDDKVTFHGWASREEINKYYREADIFLFPSYREPTGGVLLEAMSYGLPIITCAYGGTDFMVDSTCGVKVEPTTENEFVSGLVEAVDELVGNVERRATMSKAARSRAMNYFSWKDKRSRMSEVYRKTIENTDI